MSRTPVLIASLFLASALATSCRCGGGGDGDAGVDAGDGGGVDAGDAGDAGETFPTGTQFGYADGGATGWALDGGGPGASTGSGVGPNDAGYLVLNSNTLSLHYAWIANDSAGWVSKYDTRTDREIARYYSVLPVGVLRADNRNHPSRTAVDLNGDVWVANRGHNANVPGSVTKIINDTTSCPDRNGNGQIDTSRDLDGDGIEAGEYLTPGTSADPNVYDECVASTAIINAANVTTAGTKMRAAAISRGGFESTTGDVWVGHHNDRRIYKLSAATGQPVAANGHDGGTWIDVPASPDGVGWGPYGMAVDSLQRLWIVAAPGDFGSARTVIAALDTETGRWIDPYIEAPAAWNPSSMYGIAIDGKDRVWLGAWSGGAYAYRYGLPAGLSDGDAGTWTRFYVGALRSNQNTTVGRTRGIAADEDGTIWIGSDLQNSTGGPLGSQLIGINGDDGGVVPLRTDGGTFGFLDFTSAGTDRAIGVGLDSDGDVWVNNYSGNVVVYDRNDYKILPGQGGNLYTYSDFTGYQLRHFTAREGTFRYVFTGCAADARWLQLRWDANLKPSTAIVVSVKVAGTLADFDNPATATYGPWVQSPADLTDPGLNLPQGQYLQATFKLQTLDRINSPELRSFRAAYICDSIGKPQEP